MGAVSRRLPALVDAVLIVLDRNGLADVGRAVLTNNAIPTTEATSSRNQRREATLRLPTRHGLGMVPPPQLAVRTATFMPRGGLVSRAPRDAIRRVWNREQVVALR